MFHCKYIVNKHFASLVLLKDLRPFPKWYWLKYGSICIFFTRIVHIIQFLNDRYTVLAMRNQSLTAHKCGRIIHTMHMKIAGFC